MAKKLFYVELQTEPAIVLAENEDDAERVAGNNEDDILEDCVTWWRAWPVSKAPSSTTILDSIPWGSDNDMTVRQILAMTPEQIEEQERLARERAEFDAYPKLAI